jgi:hypothetical protein
VVPDATALPLPEVSAWTPTGPALDWAQVSAGLATLETVAGNSLADSSNEGLDSFEAGPATDAELSRPHLAMSDAAGNIYIADKEAHGIRRVDPDGSIHTVAGTNTPGNGPDDESPATTVALSNPNGIWVQPDGTFYVVDLDNAKIRKVTPDGTARTLVTLDSLPIGRGLWVAPDESELLIAAGSELRRWTQSDGVSVVARDFLGLGMVLRAPDGRILVGDRGAHRVLAVSEDGTTTPIAGTGEPAPFVDGQTALATPLDEPRAIWPHAGGLFIGLHAGRRVLFVDAAGIVHSLLSGAGDSHAGDGERWDTSGDKIGEVRSVTLSPAGDLIIVEHDAGFVRVVRASGS